MPNSNTLIFIPDISGFTNFVNQTEITHSSHIISELLDIIIQSNNTGLKVSEIEGDAVLFYKHHPVPSLPQLIKQAEKMFIRFHEHLIRYNNERICRCGACRTANTLSLKFVIHQGIVNTIKVSNHEKLHGADVITAHRLLKNSIESSEYVLITESFENELLQLSDNPEFSAIQFSKGILPGESNQKNSYSFFNLKHILSAIPEPSSLQFKKSGKSVTSSTFLIQNSIDEVYTQIQDFDKRMAWNPKIKDMILLDGQLNKSGAVHQCLIGDNTLKVKTLGRRENNSEIEYAERVNDVSIFKEMTVIFKLKKEDNFTNISIENEYVPRSFLNPIKPLINYFIKMDSNKSLTRLKEYSEKNIS